MKTKKFFAILLVVSLLVSLVTLPAAAEESKVEPRAYSRIVLSEYDDTYYPSGNCWIRSNEVYITITYLNGYDYTETTTNTTTPAQFISGEMRYHTVRHYRTY